MRGFELGAQQNEAMEEEFTGRLARLREALAVCGDEEARSALLAQIDDLKRVYREQARRLQKMPADSEATWPR